MTTILTKIFARNNSFEFWSKCTWKIWLPLKLQTFNYSLPSWKSFLCYLWGIFSDLRPFPYILLPYCDFHNHFTLQGRYKVQRRVFGNETTKFEWQDVLEVLRRMKTELQTFEGPKMERARMLHNYTILLMYTTVAPVSLMNKICLFISCRHFSIIISSYPSPSSRRRSVSDSPK